MICLRRPILALVVASIGSFVSTARADELAKVNRLFQSGQTAEALQRADQFLSANPKDAQMRFLRGVILSEQGKSSAAIAAFVKLNEDFPELPEPYNNLAVIYGQQGQYDLARRSLENAIRVKPDYATAYENLGDVHAKLASQAYSKALQVDSGNSTAGPKLALIRDLLLTKGRPAP